MSISFLGAQAVETGTVTATSRGTILTANASNNVKGVYAATPIIAATAYPAAWMLVTIDRGLSASDYLIDIAVGAASSEQVIIANLPWSCNSTASAPDSVTLFPVFIPAGSRVNARCQCSTGGQTIEVQLTLFAPMFGGERGLGQVETCGAVTATSLGTSVDPGGTSNTKGAWSPVIASTSFAYKWVCLSVNHTNSLTSTISFAVDIGVGAGGVEVAVVSNLVLAVFDTSDTNPAIGQCFPLAIPAGSRVSVRAACNSTTTPARLLEVVLHGVG